MSIKLVVGSIWATVASLAFMVSPAQAQNNYRIVDGFIQDAAPNVEAAQITIIQCQNNEYWIYRYPLRPHGPHFRAIIPGHWGNPLGGGDHYSFEDAARAACSW